MSSTGPTMRQRIRYRIDNIMSRGALPMLVWLGLMTLLLCVVAGVLISLLNWGPDEQETTWLEGTWLAFVRTLDPGTFGGDNGRGFRLIGLIITVIGILVFAAIIGVVSSGIDSKLADLSRGRSRVIEKGHTLILGISPKVGTVVSEIVAANASERKSCIVVLAEEDKEVIEAAIRGDCPSLGRTRLVIRTGDPAAIADLERVNPSQAKSIVVMRPDDDAGDANVVRGVLALLRLDPELSVPVVAEMADPRRAASLRDAAGPQLRVVVPGDVIARLSAQVSRSAGLSAIFQDLLDFDGDEMYFYADPALEGHAFGEMLLAFPTSSLIGVRRSTGEVSLRPPMDLVFGPGDDAIVIAEDDSTIVMASPPPWDGAFATSRAIPDPTVESTLVIGWNDLSARMVTELDHYVGPGSRLHVLADPALVDLDSIRDVSLTHQQLAVFAGDAADADDVGEQLTHGPYDHVLLLCYRDGVTPQESDARTLLTLLLTRQALDAAGQDASIVTELLQVRNVELAAVAHPDDFVVSERLSSLLIAQLAESPDLEPIFHDLLDADGSEIALRPFEDYVTTSPITFAEVVSAVRAAGDVAIGWRTAAAAAAGAPGGGAVLNPAKSDSTEWLPGDTVAVITP